MRNGYHKEYDYVMYNGDYTSSDEIRRNESLAQVVKYDENRFPIFCLQLITGEKILVENGLTSVILTKIEHLIKLGFVEEKDYFKLDDILISKYNLEFKDLEISLNFPSIVFGFKYLGSKTTFLDNKKLIEEGKINFDKFVECWSDLSNLNDLIELLEKNNIDVNIEELYKL